MPGIGIEHVATNVTKLFLLVPEGRAVILFSYSTPVALWVFGEETRRYYAKDQPTTTTRKHLSRYGPMANMRPDDHCEGVTEEALGQLIDQTTEGGKRG